MTRLGSRNDWPDFQHALIRSLSGRFRRFPLTNIWTDIGAFRAEPTPSLRCPNGHDRHRRCLVMSSDPGDLVLDPTCAPARPRTSPSSGAGAGHGRHEPVALTLARTRLMRRSSRTTPRRLGRRHPEGSRSHRPGAGDVDGFDRERRSARVRLPAGAHVTLKSIAQNPTSARG